MRQRKTPSGIVLFLLTAILVLGFALRAWGLSGQSFTMDEVAEIDTASHAVGTILHEADGFPPAYHLLLHAWMASTGGPDAARWPSVLFGVATIPIAWRLGRRIAGERAGAWAAFLLAISPFHIWYSQEARCYALYVLLAALTIWLLLRAIASDGRLDWGGFAVAGALGMYTHYYFAFVLGLGALVAIRRRAAGRGLTGPLAAYLAIGLLSLPLLWIADRDIRYQEEFLLQQPFGIHAFGYTYVSLITGQSLGPSLRELPAWSATDAVIAFLPWLIPVGAVVVILGYAGHRSLSREVSLCLGLFLFASVIGIGLLGNVAGVGYNVRYVAWVVLPFLLWLGAGASRWHSGQVRIAVIVLIGLSAFALWNRRFSERYRNEDIRAAAARIAEEKTEEVPVFALSGYMWRTVGFYLGDQSPVYAVPGARRDVDRVARTLGYIRAVTPAGGSYWLVYSRPFHGDPNGAVREALLRRHRLTAVGDFAGAELYRGVVPVGSRAITDPRRRSAPDRTRPRRTPARRRRSRPSRSPSAPRRR